MRWFRLLALLPLAWACGSDTESCKIRPSEEPGIRILECPSGTVRVVGGTGTGNCVATQEDDGWRRITCDDGTSVLIDPQGNVHYPGSGAIQGIAMLEGTDGNHAGIVVRALGTPFETETDAEGFYRLGNLPAGLYRLVFDHPGRIPEVRANIPVVNGTHTLETVHLSIALRLSPDRNATTIGSPSGDSLLIRETLPLSHRLTLLDLTTWERVHLSSNAVDPEYRFDGRKVLWTENLSSRSRIYLYDVDTGEREELPLLGTRARFFADGRVILVAKEEEAVHELAAYDTVTGETVELGRWVPGPSAWFDLLPMGPDGGSVVYHSGNTTVLYDHENGEFVLLADMRIPYSMVHYMPSGRKVVFPRPGEAGTSLIAEDLSLRKTLVLEPRLEAPALPAPDGSLVWKAEDGWRRWDETTGEIARLPLPRTAFNLVEVAFLPNGKGLVHFEFPVASLVLWGESQARLLSSQVLSIPKITSDGRHVIVADNEQLTPHTRIVRVEDGKTVQLEGVWELGPDPGWLVRHIGTSLHHYHIDSGDTGEIYRHVEGKIFVGNDALVIRGLPGSAATDGKLGIWDASDRSLVWLLEGDGPLLSKNGRYLFFRSNFTDLTGFERSDVLYRYDRETGVYDRISRNVLSPSLADVLERVILFRVGEGEHEGLYVAKGVP